MYGYSGPRQDPEERARRTYIYTPADRNNGYTMDETIRNRTLFQFDSKD